jgi:peptide/nickel transport system permease protein
VPGDVARTIMGPDATPEQVAALRTELGLDRPVWERYGDWLWDAVRGDLGHSLLNGQPVTTLLNQRLVVTLCLVVGALAIIVVVGVTLGAVSAVRGGALGRGLDVVAALLGAIPQYWLALVLIAIVAVQLRALPSIGWIPPTFSVGEWLRALILPVLAVAAGGVTVTAKQTRDAMLRVLDSDYILALRATGIAEWRVLVVHALRNASLPVLTVVGLTAVGLIGGTVLVEQVFAMPGLGTLSVVATGTGDFPTVLGGVVYFTVIVIVINVLVDILYAVLNPKVSVE